MAFSFEGGQDANGDFVLFDLSSNTIFARSAAVQNIRTRFTIAQVNAGATLLAAIAGHKYRMVGCTAISIGGAAGAVTTVDVGGTQGASGVKLVAYAQASLTQS